MFNEIKKVEDDFNDRIIYKMKSSGKFSDVEIVVDAECSGHGCLFGITLPPMSVEGACWRGSTNNPNLIDVLHVLNQILKDFNYNVCFVKEFGRI